jgi:hypothetical protein
MPRGGYYFDSIVRQPPIEEDSLRVEDNLEEFGPIAPEEIEGLQRRARRLVPEGLAVVGNFADAGFGDIALVPAPFLKEPKGIRDVEEWYVSTVTRRDYVREVFARQCEVAVAWMSCSSRARTSARNAGPSSRARPTATSTCPSTSG